MACPCDLVNVYRFFSGHYLLCTACLRMWVKTSSTSWELTDGELPDTVQPVRLGFLNQGECPVCLDGTQYVQFGGEVLYHIDRKLWETNGPFLFRDEKLQSTHMHYYGSPMHYAFRCPKGHQWHTCWIVRCGCGNEPERYPEYVREELREQWMAFLESGEGHFKPDLRGLCG